jgi:hypothetical protein
VSTWQLVALSGLGAVAVVAGAIVREQRLRRLDLERRRSTMRALRTLRAFVDDAGTVDRGGVDAIACDALRELLALQDCWYEAVPSDEDLPVMAPDGTVGALVQRGSATGLALPARVALPAGSGRFVLVGDPGVGLSPERRLVAVVIGSVLRLGALRKGAAS